MKTIVRDVSERQKYFTDTVKHSKTYTEMNDEIRQILENSLPRIQVWGIGGAGNNAINRLMNLGVEGAEMIAVNTDAQHLLSVMADRKVLIGKETTRGFGAGNLPKIGELSAIESAEEIKEIMEADLVFVTYGLGGGTGTGAGPVVAKLAREKGSLAVVTCTMPFRMEGLKRSQNASEGLERIKEISDTLVLVPNERLLQLSPDITMKMGFMIADEVLVRAVKGITELIMKPQLINLDFADVQRVVADGRIGMIGYGESNNQNNRVEEAVRETLENPLLCDVDVSSAKRALICISGGDSLSLAEAQEAVLKISNQIDPDAEVIWGASIEPDLTNSLRIICILSGVRSSLTEASTRDLDRWIKEIPDVTFSVGDYKEDNTPSRSLDLKQKPKRRFRRKSI
ncbi:MAG: cell division protein FtsZ [Candidatus Hermodarchaeota archaeon]